jgi:hypothetical protein
MGFNDGDILYGRDLQTIASSIVWNGIETQKEILAAGRTPDYLEDYLAVDTFSAAGGDNSRVVTNVGSTTAHWDSVSSGYVGSGGNYTLQTSVIKVLPNSSLIGGVYIGGNFALSGTGMLLKIGVSTNGGSNWFLTGQPIGSYLNTSGTTNMGSALRLYFYLSGTTTGSVYLKDYGAIAFPYAP